jgi:MFS superfamily sulfate permease-like transporter
MNKFENVSFWIKVLKVSAIIFIPYWLFGFETGIFAGIILACLLLSKISLTIQGVDKELKEMFEESRVEKA